MSQPGRPAPSGPFAPSVAPAPSDPAVAAEPATPSARALAHRGWAFAALAAAGCFWGLGFFFGKIALRELGVGHMLLYRFAFGCLALLPFATPARLRVRRADWRMLALGGLLGVPVQFIVQFEGLARTTVSHASLMVGTAPMLIALGAVVFMREHMDARGWLLLLVSVVGAALITLGASQGDGAGAAGRATVPGDLLVVLSLVAGVAWVLLSKHLMKPPACNPAFAVNAWMLFVGTVGLAAWVLLADGPPPVHLPATTWVAVAAPGVLINALGAWLWNWGLIRVPAAHAGAFVNLEPVIGTGLGVLLLGETLTALAVVGGVLILAAALRFTWRAPAGPPPNRTT